MNNEELDNKLAEIMTKIKSLKVENNEKEWFQKEINMIINNIYSNSQDKDYLMFQSKKRKKNITLGVICFVLGLLIAFIPSLFYICSLQNDGMPPFVYTPNSIGYRAHSSYAMGISSQEQINNIQKSKITDFNKAEIGGLVGFGTAGLFVVPAKEAKSPEYQMNHIKPQNDLKAIFNGVTFVPDIIVTFHPLKMEIIKTEVALEQAKKAKWINNKDNLSVGAAVRCPETGACFVLEKETLEKEYKKIEPIDTYRPAKDPQ